MGIRPTGGSAQRLSLGERARPRHARGQRRLLAQDLRKARAENPQFKYADEEPEKPVPTEGKHLTGFIKAPKAARERWRALAPDTQVGSGHRGPMAAGPNGAAEFVKVDPLQEVIERAEQIKKERVGGRPKDEALEGLLKIIVWVWWCVFVTDPRDSPRAGITYSGNAANDADRYGGPLLEFACAVLKSHDVPSSAFRARPAPPRVCDPNLANVKAREPSSKSELIFAPRSGAEGARTPQQKRMGSRA